MNRPLAARLAERWVDDAWRACMLDVEAGKVIIAFTCNPLPLRFNTHDPVLQYEKCMMYFLRYAPSVFEHYCFIPELTVQGNVHIHGFYTVKNPGKYYTVFLPKAKRLGFCKIKTERVDNGWLDYIHKSLPLMVEVMGSSLVPVPYTDEDDTDYLKQRTLKQTYDRLLRKPKYKPIQRHITDYIVVDDLNND